ncbi:MAG: hypothetical protein ABSG07_13980 [Terriglobales bacterium]|jgi:hypothetical protein
MKKTLFILILCLLSSSAAFAQYYNGGSGRSSEPVIYQAPNHPAHANYAPMSQEQSVLGGTSYTAAGGDRPASDFPQADAVPLGTFAREIKKQHAQLKKSRVVWVNQ